MRSAIIFVIILAMVLPVNALPSYRNYVNDYANIIDAGTESQLNEYIIWLEQNTTSELAVLTVNDIEGAVSEKSYAIDVSNSWGIGKEKADNGILVLVILGTRRIEIEVGYGLEGILPDGKVGSIIRQNTQYFKDGNYSLGISNIVQALGSEIKKEPFERADASSVAFIFPIVLFLFFFVLVIVAIGYGYLGNRCPKCKSRLKYRVIEKKEEFIVEHYCEKCGYSSKKRKKKSGFFFFPVVVPGGGSGGGGFGGFGGGSSGGGGAGGSW